MTDPNGIKRVDSDRTEMSNARSSPRSRKRSIIQRSRESRLLKNQALSLSSTPWRGDCYVVSQAFRHRFVRLTGYDQGAQRSFMAPGCAPGKLADHSLQGSRPYPPGGKLFPIRGTCGARCETMAPPNFRKRGTTLWLLVGGSSR